MSVDRDSWLAVSGIFEIVGEMKEFYRIADDVFSGVVRDMILYDDKMARRIELAHYTSWEKLLKMFEVQGEECPALRMYNCETANDPEEGKIVPPEWRDLNMAIDDLLKKHDHRGDEREAGSTYACSFSTKENGVEDDLTFWRLYGNNGIGASLKLCAVADGMYKIRYRDEDGNQRSSDEKREDEQVKGQLKSLIDVGVNVIEKAPPAHRDEMGKSIAKALRQVLDGYLYLVKSRAYETEQEWRMIQVRPRKDEVKYDVVDGVVRRYVERGKLKDLFRSASEITLGPKVPNGRAARGYIESLARKTRHDLHEGKGVFAKISMNIPGRTHPLFCSPKIVAVFTASNASSSTGADSWPGRVVVGRSVFICSPHTKFEPTAVADLDSQRLLTFMA